MRYVFPLSVAVAVCAGCGRSAAPPDAPASPALGAAATQSRDATASQKSEKPAGPKLAISDVPAPAGLRNLLQLTETLYSGSQPEGNEGFESLAAMGIKTVVSVDGARPDLETARKNGLTYVHIPIGYDGIPEKAGLALAQLMRETDGPIYIHCHHGNHRGPAAAAVACIASGVTDGASALEILVRAGTSKDYPGLWRDVEAYHAPAPGTELPELVEVAQVNSLAAAMANLDRSFDLLKLCRDAQWSVPPQQPDVVPAQEALQVKEAFHEMARNSIQDRDDRFKGFVVDALVIAETVETALRSGLHDDATQQFQMLEKACKTCHSQYRN